MTDQQASTDWYTHLRQHEIRRKRYGKYDWRAKLPNRVSIEDRPQVINQREHVVDWEVDTLAGTGHCRALVNLVERKSRYTLLQPVTQSIPIWWLTHHPGKCLDFITPFDVFFNQSIALET